MPSLKMKQPNETLLILNDLLLQNFSGQRFQSCKSNNKTVSTVSVSQLLRLRMSLVQVVVVVLGVVIKDIRGQDYGPVNLDTVDPLSLSWNQIHWLVKDQIKEVEELKAEHDEIYNEITGCYGLEKCLAEFDLLDIKPGSKLWNLGLRKVNLSMSALTKQREEVVQNKIRLDAEMKEKGISPHYVQFKNQSKADFNATKYAPLEDSDQMKAVSNMSSLKTSLTSPQPPTTPATPPAPSSSGAKTPGRRTMGTIRCI